MHIQFRNGWLLATILLCLVGIVAESPTKAVYARSNVVDPTNASLSQVNRKKARQRMATVELPGRGITDASVLAAMERIPREKFVPPDMAPRAYSEDPLPIGYDQTISAPFIVALMTQLAHPRPNSRALNVGTGSGYQAAVLGQLCKTVDSIEIVKPLAEEAGRRLKSLGYKNITVHYGDGYQGWKVRAPFDLIIVAAAPDRVPQPLIDQLAPGGRLIIPVGRKYQQLTVIEKDAKGKIHNRTVRSVKFVPMTGKAQHV